MKADKRKKHDSWLFWTAFWISIAILVGIYLYAQVRVAKLVKNEQGEVVLNKTYSQVWHLVLPDVLKDMEANFEQASDNISEHINEQIDEAFAPVYTQIPKFADFHYSVTGEYTEIISALSGDISKDLQRILFDEINLEERLEQSQEEIASAALPIVTEVFNKTGEMIQQKMSFSDEEMLLMGNIVAVSAEDAKERFSDNFNAIRAAGTAAGATAVGAMSAKVLGKKIAAKVATKVAAKGAIKAGSIASGAGAGAVAGSWGGPVGAIVGGIVGAAAAWLATDQIIISADEYFNREEFELEIKQLVDEEKTNLKARLLQAYQQQLDEMVQKNADQLKNIKTTKELILLPSSQ